MKFLLHATRERKRTQRGFSFIELVIVVAVMGIITAIAIPTYGGVQASAKQAAVAATAENGLRLTTALAVGAAPAAASYSTPQEALETLTGAVIGASFLDEAGTVITNPGSEICVWAYNKQELLASGVPRYQAFEGTCPSFPEGAGPTIPGSPGGGSGGDGTDNPSNPTNPGGDGDTEGPGEGENPEGNHPGDATADHAQFVLQCDATQQWTPQLANFTGEQHWNDDVTQAGLTPRELQAGQEYIVDMVGTYNGFAMPVTGAENDCLKRVNSWGSDSGTTSLAYGAVYAKKLEYVAAPPSSVTDVSLLLAGSGYNSSLAHWDTSKITNFFGLFNVTPFNQPLASWDMSNAENITSMFQGASAFNQPINNWNISKVTKLDNVFQGAAAFNQPLDSWDVSNVTTTSYMFSMARSFNQSLNSWDVSNVTSMERMFSSAESFNSNISDWDVSNVRNMTSTFQQAYAFNQPLGSWDVSGATTMNRMFNYAYVFNQDISAWDVSKVTDMRFMFHETYEFRGDLSSWHVEQVTRPMREAFALMSNMNAYGSQPLWSN